MNRYQGNKEIEFIHEWMGNPPGSKIKMFEGMATILIERGTAKEVNQPGGKVMEPDSDEGADRKDEGVKKTSEQAEKKELRRPPKDKQVKSPKKSK